MGLSSWSFDLRVPLVGVVLSPSFPVSLAVSCSQANQRKLLQFQLHTFKIRTIKTTVIVLRMADLPKSVRLLQVILSSRLLIFTLLFLPKMRFLFLLL